MKSHGNRMGNGRRRRRQAGFVLVLMASLAMVVIAATGLAVDMGRLFIAKQETQAFVDAAAIAAALELDGTTAGTARAATAVTSTGNTWNLNTRAVSGATVDFGTSKNGPWVANPNPATGYIAARVRLTVPDSLYFLPVISHTYTQNVASAAVAIATSINTFKQGASPYTAVAQNLTGPNFGFVTGTSYTIQWPPTNGGPNCKLGSAQQCFVKKPCAGDSDAVDWKVYNYWNNNTNGYWGFSSNSDIRSSVLDGLQTQPVSVGDNILPIMTNGNKAVQATYLDERTQQDAYNGSNDVNSYLTDPNHNGRRLMLVPVVSPESTSVTRVVGWAYMLLFTNGNSSNYYNHESNGNDPFCAMYVGPANIGSNDNGGATSGTGAYYVSLVQ